MPAYQSLAVLYSILRTHCKPPTVFLFHDPDVANNNVQWALDFKATTYFVPPPVMSATFVAGQTNGFPL
ncbi:hypothetical protein B9K05_01705 [Acetobacter syzygii]|uniref:Uncharacterized protein n=1 Tax=Acetobacter syzygii TaxID=146476 RepID=A0A270BWN0_9PROT|nr:hypothetical protein B9K05_01705 [Acetobacter syzygii]